MHRPLPDLTTLQCFLALSRHLNFRAAARAVSLSPAAFGERIKRLEEEVGAPLFERTTRQVKLTALGATLRPHAQDLIERGWRWADVANDSHQASPYELRIGTRFELGMSWLVPSLTTLETKRPERSINIKWGTDDELLRLLTTGELDAMISSVRLNDPSLRVAPLHREDYVFVSSSQLKIPAELSAADAPSLTLIDTEAHCPLFRYFLDALSSGELWRFKRVEEMGTIGAVRARVKEGVGVAVLPRYFVQRDLEDGSLTQLCADITLHHDFFRLVWHAEQVQAHLLHELVEDLSAIPLS